MKTKILIYLIIGLSWTSCAYRYQIHEVSSDGVQEVEEDIYLYTSEDISITYDFWVEGGSALFEVYNERDSTLYLDLKKSQFIINGEKFAYFEEPIRNRTKEPRQQSILKIDAQESYTIEGFPVSYDWQRIPKQQNALEFGQGNSPLVFKNRLVYAFDSQLKDKKALENKFWVKGITQFKKRDFKTYKSVEQSKSNKFYTIRNSDPEASVYWLEIIISVMEVILWL